MLPGSWNITERGKLHFSGLGAPKKENNYAFCQVGKTNGLLYVFDESLFSLVQLKGKRVSGPFPRDTIAVNFNFLNFNFI